jgi:hypothetical protein
MEVLDSLLSVVRRCCEGFPDKRTGTNSQYTMADIGLAALSVFFTQSPSFLDHQRQLETVHGRSNCQTLFGISRIPTDNHIRDMLDPVAPDYLFPAFAAAVAALERSGGIRAFQRLGSHLLIALDGTEYHRSAKVHCRHCSTRTRKGQPTESFHTLLCATIVAPGRAQVVPLEPEFIRPQDGHDKQDCESRAVRRWLKRHGARYKRLNPIYLGDDLHACQPVCEAVLEQGGHFLFTCKPASHQTIQEYLTGIEPEEHVEQVKRGRERATVRYRWLCGVPLRGDEEALTVNWLMVEILNAKGEVTYRNSFITDLPVTRATVAELAACGRARWKIENESFNVLKNRGYHLEHNFGHGKEHLAALLACFNLVAFAIHTVCDLALGAWRHARETLGPRTRFFHNLQALSTYVAGRSHMALVVEDGGCWGRRGWTLNADSALRPCHGRIRRLLCRGR